MLKLSDSLRTLAFISALSLSSLYAQDKEPAHRFFPFTPVRIDAGGVLLEPELLAMEELATLERVVLDGVIDSNGGMLKLELKRVNLRFDAGAVHVDEVAIREAMPAGMSLWSGNVSGAPQQKAFLAISPYGTRGWFGEPHQLQHFTAQPIDGDWSRTQVLVQSQATIEMLGVSPSWTCQAESVGRDLRSKQRARETEMGSATFPVFEAPIAFETDFEFYQRFGNLGAAQSYAISLIGAISNLYFEEVGVIFRVPYLGFHTANNDPWTAAACDQKLIEFSTAWAGNQAPVKAIAYHMMSGVVCGGGIAYLDVLCNRTYGFGVSGELTGMSPIPPAQGPLSWDFVVIAHELGHNFGAIHTHEYQPPIDNCGNGNCSNPAGTIMSYCHTCAGGLNNIALTFHPSSAADMRAAVEASCLRALVVRNDDCDRSQRLYSGPNGPFSNAGASDSEPAWTCGGTSSRDMWFTYTADCTGTLTFDTCNSQTNFDSKLAVFSGACDALQQITCNDDFCGVQSQVSIEAIAGTTYYVRAGGWNGSYGDFVLTVLCGGAANTNYNIAWKVSTKPGSASGFPAFKGAEGGTCVVANTGTFEADFLEDGTWINDARGKAQAAVSLADMQRLMDDIYGNGLVTLESFVKTKVKLTPKAGKNGAPGKIKCSISATLLFNGGQVIKVKAAFSGLED